MGGASKSSTVVFGRFPEAKSPALAQLEPGTGALQNPSTDGPVFENGTEAFRPVPTEVSFGPFRLLPTIASCPSQPRTYRVERCRRQAKNLSPASKSRFSRRDVPSILRDPRAIARRAQNHQIGCHDRPGELDQSEQAA